MFRYGRSYAETLLLGQFWQGVHRFRFFFTVCFQSGAEPLVDLFPAGDKHGLSLGGELVPCTGEHSSHSFVLMGCSHRAEQLGADKVHQLALTFRKTSEALFCKFSRGNDGMMVRYLFAVQHTVYIRCKCKSLGKGQQPQ